MRISITVAALVAALFSMTASADDRAGQWYVAPQVIHFDDDKLRAADDDIGGQLGFGVGLSEYADLEFNAWGAELGGFNAQNVYGLGLDLLMYIGGEGAVSPYVLLGTGWTKSDKAFGTDRSGMSGTLGAGVRWRLTQNGVALRTEARVRSEFEAKPRLDDVQIGLGLHLPIGKRVAQVVDSDGDGVPDGSDRCPGTAPGTAVDQYGCERDDDGDGVPNARDDCPNTAKGVQVNARGCERDDDGDGVGNTNDKCPNTPKGVQVDARGCELDDDKDGVGNSRDRCPNTKPGVRVDVYGCEIKSAIQLPGVLFELNSARLVPATTRVLDDAAATLRNHSDLDVEVAGHTDSSGSDAYNQDLSRRRALAVLDYLRTKGVTNKMSARGYGESDPIADNSTSDGRQRNRRVELKILNQ